MKIVKNVKVLILRVRLYFIDKCINSNEKDLKRLEVKEIALEKKLKALGYVDVTEREE